MYEERKVFIVHNENNAKLFMFEMFICIVATSFLLIKYTDIHPVFGIVLGVLTGVILAAIFSTKIGFFFLTGLFSIGWFCTVGLLVYKPT